MLISGCTWTTYRPPLPPEPPNLEDCYDVNDDRVFYESQDAEECNELKFHCEWWQKSFSNECGCGCVLIEKEFEGVL